MISEFDFPDAPALLPRAVRAAKHIAEMKRRARRSRWSVIYVNDAPGVWESDRHDFVRRCFEPRARGRKIVELLAPAEEDYFLFKPRHSAFFDTSLHSILSRLRVKRLILTGVTAHQCVLFTAMDAYIRGYQLAVPSSCVASPTSSQTRHALAILVEALNAKLLR
jgi:nicotinamidase-related amidase